MTQLDEMVAAVSLFDRLTEKDFIRIAELFGVNPDDDALIERLVSLGWTYCMDEPYPYIKMTAPSGVTEGDDSRGVSHL